MNVAQWTIGILLFLGFVSEPALAQTQMPPVTVRAMSPSGVQVLCRGSACQAVVASLVENSNFEYLVEAMPLSDVYDRTFCDALEDAAPQDCQRSNGLPNAPGWNLFYTPASCEGTDNWFASASGSLLANVSGYTNDVNEPINDYSFQGACQELTACWEGGGARSTCTSQFDTTLAGICGSNTSCGNARSVYVSIANNNLEGAAAYNSAQLREQCAGWYVAMEENLCP